MDNITDLGPSKEGHRVSELTPRPTPGPFYLRLDVVLYVFLVSNSLSAAYSPIQDCDEVFNYWEPTHYLHHNYGLQTWEYSPAHSIRSWLYIALHALVGKLSSLFTPHKSTEFYVIRFTLAIFCAACETRLYSAINRNIHRRISFLFLVIVAFAPGMFHSSSSFLPSSFAMYTSMLGLAAFLDSRSSQKISQGIMWFGLGAILGWPFSGALIIPLVSGEILVAAISDRLRGTIADIANGLSRCLFILCVEIAVDSIFFGRTVIVPWNIVAYNIFGGDGHGPSIFGTEPWTFYMHNLLLNFNVWFVLAISLGPLLILQGLFRSHTVSREAFLRTIGIVSPFYLWLAIFTLQPHKEERFMYPAYPFLALNAALAFDLVLSFIGSARPRTLMGLIPPKVKLIAIISFVLLAVNVGLLRIVGITTAYNAPLRVYAALESQNVPEHGVSVCMGKEWYRFPSSYFLPNNMRAKFIKSEFRGLLPGEFSDAPTLKALFEGTSAIPLGMNDRNEEDPGKYIDITQCDFLVDTSFPGIPPTLHEPNYVHNTTMWRKISCERFLDSSRTSILSRIIWTPDLSIIPDHFRRQWGEYCLLRRRDE